MERFRGRTLTFKYTTGAMAHKAYAHTFSDDGGVSYKPADADGEGEGTRAEACSIEKLREDVWIVAYRGAGGYTLTSVLDFATNRLISIASNDQELSVHSGTFETARETTLLEPSDVEQSPTPIH